MNEEERRMKNFVESAFAHGVLFAVRFQREHKDFNLQGEELEKAARRVAGKWWNKYYQPMFRRFDRIVDKAFKEALSIHADAMKKESDFE